MKKHRRTPVARAISLLLTFAMLTTLFLPAGAVGTEEAAAPAAPTDSSFVPEAFEEAESLTDLFYGNYNEDEPFEINSVEQLVFLQRLVNGEGSEALREDFLAELGGFGTYFLLTTDLDLSSYVNWTPIGDSAEHYFGGSLNGGNHTVSGLNVSVTAETGNAYAGLFGHTRGAEFSNLTVKGSVSASAEAVGGNAYAGGIVGYGYTTDLTGCKADELTVTASEAGGCTFTASVNGTGSILPANILSVAYAGGMAGYVEGTADVEPALVSCSATDTVTVKAISTVTTATLNFDGAVAGGVVGAANGANLTGCSSAADVSFQAGPWGTASYSSREFYYMRVAGGVAGALLGLAREMVYEYTSGQYTYRRYGYTLVRTAEATGCTSTATVSAVTTGVQYNYPAVGGVIGAVSYANVTGAASTAAVSGAVNLGGVIGVASGTSTISGCSASAGVKLLPTADNYVGGIVGHALGMTHYTVKETTGGTMGNSYSVSSSSNTGKITACENNTAVTGADYTGGIAGYSRFQILDSTNNGAVTSTGSVAGGITGCIIGGIQRCVNNGAVSGMTEVGGIYGQDVMFDSNSQIRDNANNGTVTGSGYVGGIGGSGSRLTGNINTGTVTGVAGGANLYVGGIVGYGMSLTINACVNEGSVKAVTGGAAAPAVRVGGLTGYAYGSAWQIYNSVNKGDVTSTQAYTGMGGLVGEASSLYGGGELFNCYNLGSVQGRADNVGGVVGMQSGMAAVRNNYSAGAVSSYAAGYNAGGIAGSVDESTSASYVTDNYYQADACDRAVGQDDVAIGAAGTFDKGTLTLTALDEGTELRASDLTAALDKWVKDMSDTISLCWTLPGGEIYPTFGTDTVSPAEVPGVYTFSADGGETTADTFSVEYGGNLVITAAGYLSSANVTDPETGEASVIYTDVIGAMSYQWYETATGYPELDGTAVEGANSAALTVDATKPGTYIYYVVGTNTTVFGDAASSQSQLITVTVVKNPDDPAYYAGDVAAFSGSGTETDPYIIDSPAKLAYLAQQVNDLGKTFAGEYFKQTADIDLNNQPWTPIGTVYESSSSLNSASGLAFQGTYDGDNHKITNLRIVGVPSPTYSNISSAFVMGLFNYTSGAAIKNLTLESGVLNYTPNFTGGASKYKYVALGGLVGYTVNTTIENCHNTGVTIPMETDKPYMGSNYTYVYLGGLAGYTDASEIRNSSNSVDLAIYPLTGMNAGRANYAGGLTGSGGTFEGCVNSGSIRGEYAGGITGSGSCTDCENTGAVTGFYAGGVVANGGSGGVTGCVNSGTVTGLHGSNTGVNGEYAGGVVGSAGTGAVLNCVNTGTVTGYIVGGIAGRLGSTSGVIANCYNTGAVTAGEGQTLLSNWDSAAGGICGYTYYGPDQIVRIENCCSTGTVTNALVPNRSTGNTGAIIGWKYGGYSGTELTVRDCYYTQVGLTACGGVHGEVLTGSILDGTVNVLAVGTIGADGAVTAAEGTTLDFIGTFSGAEGLVGLLNCWAAGNLAAYPAVSGWKAGTAENTPAVFSDETLIAAADFTVTASMDDEDGAVDYGTAVKLTASMDFGENAGEQGTVTWQWYRSAADVNDPALAVAIAGATDMEYSFNATDAGTWYYFAVAVNTGTLSKVSRSTETLKLTVGKATDDPRWYGVVADGYAGGDGTVDNPYQIATPEQLAYLAQQVNGGEETSGTYYKLTNDINASDWDWTPIGGTVSFQGTLDGDGYTVTIHQSDANARYSGLFGAMNGASVHDLTVAGEVTVTHISSTSANQYGYFGGVVGSAITSTLTNVTGKVAVTVVTELAGSYNAYDYVGGVAGSFTGTMTGVTNEGAVTYSGTCYYVYLGGVVGNLGASTLTDAVNTGTVTYADVASSSNSGVGGVAGYLASAATLEHCRNTGALSSTTASGSKYSPYAGGLIGYTAASPVISNSWNTGDRTGTASSNGGLIGYAKGNTGVTITNCYNAGAGYNGGLIGYLYQCKGTMANCYSVGEGVTRGLINSVYTSASYPFTVTNCFALAGANPPLTTMTGLTQVSVGAFDSVTGYIAPANGAVLTYGGSLLPCLNSYCLDNGTDYVWAMGKDEGYPVLVLKNTVEGLSDQTMAAPVLTEEGETGLAVGYGAACTLTVGVKTTAYTPAEGEEGTATALGTVTYQWYQRITDLLTGVVTVLPVENASGTLTDGTGTITLNVPTTASGVRVYFVAVINSTDYRAAQAVSQDYTVTVGKAADDTAWYGGSEVFTEGDGTEGNPYLIYTPEQLAFLMEQVNAGGVNAGGTAYADCQYKVMNDLSVSHSVWTPIGTSAHPFNGVFDGNGKTVTVAINSTLTNQALFGYSSGTVKNLAVDGSVTTTAVTAAGVVAQNSGTVDNCINKAAVITTKVGTSSASNYAGGVVAYNTGTVKNSVNYGSVSTPTSSAYHYVGGVVGYSTGTTGTVENCTNYGGNLTSYYVGGVVGYLTCSAANSTVSVTGCVNEADISVETANTLGGVVGYVKYGKSTSSHNVIGCTNRGDLSGTSTTKLTIGGIVGQFSNYSTVVNCVNEGSVTGVSTYLYGGCTAGGIIGSGGGSKATVSGCVNLGSITGNYSAGGILGEGASNMPLTQCVNVGSIACSSVPGAVTADSVFKAGGIAGNANGCLISQCVNSGDILSEAQAGGITGYSSSSYTTITDCINNGTVSNTEDSPCVSGGLVGYASAKITITTSYSAGQADGGVIGKEGATQAVITDGYYLGGTAPTGVGVTTFTHDNLIASAAALAGLNENFVSSGETVTANITINSGDAYISAQVGGETVTGVSTLTVLPNLKWIVEFNEAAGDDGFKIPVTLIGAVDITPVAAEGYAVDYATLDGNTLPANREDGYTVAAAADEEKTVTLYSVEGHTFRISAGEGVTFAVTGAISLGEGSYSSNVTDTVTFTVAVADGYVLDGVTADGAALKAVKGVYTVPAHCQSIEINATKTYVVTVSIKHADVMANQLINNDDSYTVRVNDGITFTIDVEDGCVILAATANGVPLSPDKNGDYGLPVTEDVEIIVTVKRAYSGSAGQKGITEIIDSVAGNTQTAEAVDSTYDDTLDYNDDEKNDLLDILEILYRQKAENAAVDTPAVDAPAVDAPAVDALADGE